MRMKIDTKYTFENKLEYLKLVLKISKIRYGGDDPPQALLKQAVETCRLAGVSEAELNKI